MPFCLEGAVHYYKFNIKDWTRDTAHLSVIEEGIYRRLLDHYYESEKPIPVETQSVIRRLRLAGHEEETRLILSEYFVLGQDGYRHTRCDQEIAAYHAQAERNRRNGQSGGRPNKPTENPVGSQKKPSGNLNHKPLTINQEPKEKSIRFAALAALLAAGVVDQVAQDFIALRKAKRLPITKTALGGIEREAAQAGMTLADAIRTCVERGWGGFKASWMQNQQGTIHDKRASTIAGLTGNWQQEPQWIPADRVD